MKFTVDQKVIQRELAIVGKCVSPRSTLPVLGNVLLKVENNKLTLAATNLEVGMQSTIPVSSTKDGAVTVPAATLIELISGLTGSISFELNAKTVNLYVVAGYHKSRIKGIDAEEFPPFPKHDDIKGVVLPVSEFKTLVQRTAISTSDNQDRPILTSVHIVLKENRLELASADGFRLSRVVCQLENAGDDFVANVPVTAMVNGLQLTTGDTIFIGANSKQFVIKADDRILISQLVEGNYPDIEQIIPKKHKTRIVFNKAMLSAALKQASIFVRGGTNIVRLDCKPDVGAKIISQSEETGDYAAELSDVTVEGDAIQIAFNVKYLLDVVTVCKATSIALETTSNVSPGAIRFVDDDSFVYVIMPMHIQDETPPVANVSAEIQKAKEEVKAQAEKEKEDEEW